MRTVAVVGGGPAGMMAAYVAATGGARVTLFEHNEKLGKKLYITGKGRCNVTNACDLEDFFQNIPVNGKFLYAALYTLSNDALLELLRQNGLETKVERGGRVFPQSDKASDVIRCLRGMLEEAGVEVRLQAEVKGLALREGRAEGIRLEGGALPFDAVILATGGRSYPKTGSTGDGYAFARQAGHTVTAICPSLIPLTVKEADVARSMQGLSLKNVGFSLVQGKRELFSGLGELLFTHFGLSGPLVLSASAHIANFDRLTCLIDWKPGLDERQLDARLLRDFAAAQNKQLKNVMAGLLPAKAIEPVIRRAGLKSEKTVNAITREEREALRSTLKSFAFTVTGTRPIDEAIITRGGVATKEVNPSTMESRLAKNLFFAGELLDVDAYTGGFNLQIAFSTGFLAGRSAAETPRI